jgi:hypothetical protein
MTTSRFFTAALPKTFQKRKRNPFSRAICWPSSGNSVQSGSIWEGHGILIGLCIV